MRKEGDIRRVVFLDFDGVCNSLVAYLQVPEEERDVLSLCEYNVQWLNEIDDAVPGIHWVISSSWRMGRTTEELQDILAEAGFRGKVHDQTGKRVDQCLRGTEIIRWLAKQPEEYDIAIILDDESDMGVLSPCLIQTDFDSGLSWRIAREVIQRLMPFEILPPWMREA